MTLSVSGLQANTDVTAYFYGAGNSAGSGCIWSLNGSSVATINYDGSATGRDITLASS